MVKISCTVTDLYEVEYHQSFIEKIFNVGHISFKGNARYTAKIDLDRIKEKRIFKIYGIVHFSRFKEEFSLALKRDYSDNI